MAPIRALLLGVGIQRRQLGALREDPELLLPREDQLAIGLVAHVEAAFVLLDPLLRRVVRRVRRAGAEVHEERLLRRDHLRVLDELDRLVGEVRRQVVAVLRQGWLFDRMVVVDEVGIPLVRFAAEEAVEALEPPPDRPVALRRGHVHLVRRTEVPLAEHVRVPAALAEHLGDRRALERDVAVPVREAGCRFGDAGHPVRGVVAAGQQRRARRRAQRSRVPVRVRETVLGEPVDVRRLDQTAPRLHRGVADVVENDPEHVRSPVGRNRLHIRLPVRNRVADVDIDHTSERLRHGGSLLVCAAERRFHGACRDASPQVDERRGGQTTSAAHNQIEQISSLGKLGLQPHFTQTGT
jgi:hypothetical protein